MYVAWMSRETPNVIEHFKTEISESQCVRIIIPIENEAVHIGAYEMEPPSLMCVFHIQSSIRWHAQVSLEHFHISTVFGIHCDYGGMAIYNKESATYQHVALFCESMPVLDNRYGVFNLTSTENKIIVVVYGYSSYSSVEFKFSMYQSRCQGFFIGVHSQSTSFVVQEYNDYEGKFFRLRLPCLTCFALQFINLPGHNVSFIEYELQWERSFCLTETAVLVTATSFPPSHWEGRLEPIGMIYLLSEEEWHDFTRSEHLGVSFRLTLYLTSDFPDRNQIVKFRKSECVLPCALLPFNPTYGDYRGQVNCDVCRTYILQRRNIIYPMPNSCIKITSEGKNCTNTLGQAEISYLPYHYIQINFTKEIDLYVNDLYTSVRVTMTNIDTNCLSLATIASSSYRIDILGYDLQLSFDSPRYVSYIGKRISWNRAVRECEKQGNHLVTVNSEQEQDELIAFVKSYFIKEGVPIGLLKNVSFKY